MRKVQRSIAPAFGETSLDLNPERRTGHASYVNWLLMILEPYFGNSLDVPMK
jgi:hypothetical protein